MFVLVSGSLRKERYLFFHALASNSECKVSLDVLNNATTWDRNLESMPREFQEIGKRSSQATAEAMDKNGNLFFGLENPIAIACWDAEKPFTGENLKIVVEDNQTLQFVSGLKIIPNKKGKQELWATSCRFQVKFFQYIFSQSFEVINNNSPIKYYDSGYILGNIKLL